MKCLWSRGRHPISRRITRVKDRTKITRKPEVLKCVSERRFYLPPLLHSLCLSTPLASHTLCFICMFICLAIICFPLPCLSHSPPPSFTHSVYFLRSTSIKNDTYRVINESDRSTRQELKSRSV